MSLVDTALKHLKGKRVVVVCAFREEDYLQELTGTLIDGQEDCLVIQEEDDPSPTVVNAAFVAWVYEDTGEDEEAEEG